MRYLLVTYIRKPGGQIDEQVGFAKRLRNGDIQTCNVIMDYAQQQVTKCVIEGRVLERDFMSLHTYYEQAYPKMIGELARMNGAIEVVAPEETIEPKNEQ